MFHLYQHHDADVLASLLAALRDRSLPASPLQPDTIIVPDRGIGRWLQAGLAELEGCAANLELLLPGRFVWSVLRDTLPGEPDSSDFEGEQLAWHLYALLPDVELPEISRYLTAQPPEQHRYQLARQLAHVFDQYLIHRRDVLADWEVGRERHTPPTNWQAPVWRALQQRIGVRDRARLMTDFLQLATNDRIDPSRLPDPVYAFGLTDLPQDYLRLLHAISRHVDVHFLLPNPSTAYWGDIEKRRFAADEAGEKEGHPLLASLGGESRDFLAMLFSDEFADLHEPDLGDSLRAEIPQRESLLHCVRAGIIAGDTDATQQVDDAGTPASFDHSIQVHACHGPVREIQVLHDRLLELLSRHQTLQPREILVLVPDMSRYAAAIHSVFSAATGPRYIPYTVSDQPRRDTHPVARTFQQLTELPLSRWTVNEITALAGVPAVMRRFGLDDNDLADLRSWCAKAGIRWGLDADSRAAAGSAAFVQNSWQFGLDRLLLGLVQQDDETLVDGVAPWSNLEGGAAIPLGSLWLLVDRLRHWREELVRAATADVWQERLNTMVDDLFRIDPDDPDENDAFDAIQEAIAALEAASEAMPDETISWEAVRECLLENLVGGAQRQPILTGGVSFAGRETLRGIPFSVICMVGMDDGMFPRQESQRGFNLLPQAPRRGDPDIRDRDRMIFLQALMSARQCFYISYTGRNTGDGAPLQPSPVVSELLDFLHACHFPQLSSADFRREMVTEQALHPFSPRHFVSNEARLFTFVEDWAAAARAQAGERRPGPPLVDERRSVEAEDIIDLNALQWFYQHPPRWFFGDCMNLMLEDESSLLDDEEPRVLDGLARYRLRARLFEHACRSGQEELPHDPGPLERARGQLPPPPLGHEEHAAAAIDINALLPVYRRWQQEELDRETTDVAIDLYLPDGTRLMGAVTRVGRDEIRRIRPAGLRLAHLLNWWLEYLALVASGHARGLRLAGVRDGVAGERVARISRETAMELLSTAVGHYRDGQTQPLLFEPYLAEKYLETLTRTSRDTGEPKTPAQALDDVNGWLSNRFRPPAQAKNPWLIPLYGDFPLPLGGDPDAAALVRLSRDVAAPIHEHLHEVEGPE